MRLIPETKKARVLIVSLAIVAVLAAAAAICLGVRFFGNTGDKHRGDAAADGDLPVYSPTVPGENTASGTGEGGTNGSAQSGTSGTDKTNGENGGSADNDASDADTASGTASDCGIEIEDVFQYTGPNPDCDLKSGNAVAAVRLKNISGKYIGSADIALYTDGGMFTFEICDIADGESVVALDRENTSAEKYTKTLGEDCSVVYTDAPQSSAGLSARVNAGSITVTNVSGETVQSAVVVYRTVAGGEYFGGKIRRIEFESISSGETVTETVSVSGPGSVKIVYIK